MPHATTEWTVEMVHALPEDGNRYEVIDGRLLVSPPPTYRHQRAARELTVLLHSYLLRTGVGALIPAPAGVDVDARTEVEPDLFVLPLVNGREPNSFAEAGRLLLAIEILSPSSARTDRRVKRALYARMGVPEYWIVDPDERAIERWLPGAEMPEVIREHLKWQPDPGLAAFVIDLAEMFARI